MIVGVDHILIAVEDLDKARDLYIGLGFEVLYGGKHELAGTHNALIPLADGSYLELVGVADPSLAPRFPFGRQVLEALGRTNRFAGFALEINDYSHDVQAIRDRGLALAKAAPGERLKPDGERISWWTAHPEDARLPFLIEDLTPRRLRAPAASEGIGQTTRVGRVEVGASDVQSLMTRFAQLLGERPAEDRFTLQRGTIKLSQSFSGDGIQMAVLLTKDTAGIAADWKARGISFYDEEIRGTGRVLVPRDTDGARISFCQAQWDDRGCKSGRD